MREVSDLLSDALILMDTRGRGIDGGSSRVLWEREWEELRLNIFNALQLELAINRKIQSLLQEPVELDEENQS